MRLLLDTHTFVWWDSEPQKLSNTVLNLIFDKNNQVMLSFVSIWEIQIKHQLGKLPLRIPLTQIINHQQNVNNLELLPITVSHILMLDQIPIQSNHSDPFDRLLIAQAISENIPILSRDTQFANYPIQVIW